jgi:phage terminase Nu1 subunit (DNA packaging protein)
LDAETAPGLTETPDVVGVADLAAVFRVAEKTIWAWVAAGMPILHRGSRGAQGDSAQLSFRACAEWYFAENYERLELTRQQTRVAHEQATKLQMENALREGRMANLDHVAKARALELTNFRARLRAAPSKLAPRVNPENPNLAADLIAAELDVILAELADADWSGLVGDGGDVSGMEVGATTAPEADGERVGRQVPNAQRGKQRRARAMEHR